MNQNIKKRRNKQSARGYALLIVLMLAPLFFMLTATILDRVKVDLNFTNKDRIMKQAYYIAEAGEVAAFYELSANNYEGCTHDDFDNPVSASLRLPITLPNTTIDADGWFVWQWNPGDTHKSFTGTGVPEKFRYKIKNVSGTQQWTIDVEGYYGDYKRIIQVTGVTETAFLYALFANDVLSEFTRGASQNIYGRVHSNGNMFFRPDGSTLKLYSEKVTAAGDMYRFEDAWGRPDRGGTVQITDATNTLRTMNGKSQGWNGKGNAFDTFHDLWLDSGSSGALQKWDGVVMDGSLGAGRQEPPPVESMMPNGYYHNHAGLVVTSSSIGSGISNASFYNRAEGRQENVKDLDMTTLPYPTGGVIYSEVPVRLINADKLPGKLTIVSCCNIYTKGDVNKEYEKQSDYTSGVSTKVPLALMTTARLYHLSDYWDDSQNTASSGKKTAGNDERYYGNATGVSSGSKNIIEVNAALVDGPPQVDEINYVAEWNGVTNPVYSGHDDTSNYCWANSDDLLENWGGRTLLKRGSIVHLENATMASLDNSDQGPGITAWTVKTHYNPPTRNYGYDNDFTDRNKQPPMFPVVSKRLLWKLVK